MIVGEPRIDEEGDRIVDEEGSELVIRAKDPGHKAIHHPHLNAFEQGEIRPRCRDTRGVDWQLRRRAGEEILHDLCQLCADEDACIRWASQAGSSSRKGLAGDLSSMSPREFDDIVGIEDSPATERWEQKQEVQG